MTIGPKTFAKIVVFTLGLANTLASSWMRNYTMREMVRTEIEKALKNR